MNIKGSSEPIFVSTFTYLVNKVRKSLKKKKVYSRVISSAFKESCTYRNSKSLKIKAVINIKHL